MAKRKSDLADIFKKTTPAPTDEEQEEVPVAGRTLSIGVGLKEAMMLDEIVEELGSPQLAHALCNPPFSAAVTVRRLPSKKMSRATPKAKLKMP